MVDPRMGKAPLITEPLIIDHHILAPDNAAQLMGAGIKAQVTADGTVIADTGRAFNLPWPVTKARDTIRESADRAQVNNVAAGFGVDRLPLLDIDDGFAAAFKERQLWLIFPLFQVADTAPTDDTALLIQHNRVGDHIVFLLAPFGFHQLADARAKAHGLILQGALAAFVADRAIEWVIEQDKGQVGFLRRLDLGRIRAHHHAFCNRHRAGSLQHRPTRAADLDQTHATARHWV